MSEIGPELKVSELHPPMVVAVQKSGHPVVATIWCVGVTAKHVFFHGAAIDLGFIAFRTGEALEQITDDTGQPMKMFQYHGK